MVLLQKWLETSPEVFHLLNLAFVKVHPYLHPVERFGNMVWLRRNEPYPVYSFTIVEVFPQKVEHQRFVDLLIVFLGSFNLKNQGSAVFVGLVLPRRFNFSFKIIDRVNDL